MLASENDYPRRRAMRLRMIYSYINSKSPKHPISNGEFKRIAGFNSEGAARSFVDGMVKDGFLVRHSLKDKGSPNKPRYGYAIGKPLTAAPEETPKKITVPELPTDVQIKLHTTSQPKPTTVRDVIDHVTKKATDEVIETIEQVELASKAKNSSAYDLERLAQQFFWETGNDSLKAFVEWTKNKA